MGKSRPPQ
uniref:Uncharacterized protein n=1 Tax=Anguilla anguilla TaxID=7936 RepID=A0A0E9QTI2_ANGAN